MNLRYLRKTAKKSSTFSQQSDFDLMMAKRKEENRMKRLKGKKSDSSFIGDADDSINSMLNRMKEAADADKKANRYYTMTFHWCT